MSLSLACTEGVHDQCMRRTCSCTCGHPGRLTEEERDAVLDEAAHEWDLEPVAQVYELAPIGRLRTGPNVRVEIAGLDDLVESIRRLGILEPLVACPGDAGFLDVLMGQRRLTAARAAGLEHVPVIVRPRPTDRDRLLMQLAENLERADMTPIEEAHALAELVELGLDQRKAGAAVNRSQFWVSTRLQLLTMPDIVQTALHERRITPSVALSVPRKLFDDRRALKTLADKCDSNEALRSWAHAETVRLAGNGQLKGGYQLQRPISVPVEYIDLVSQAAKVAGKTNAEWLRDTIRAAAHKVGVDLPEHARRVTAGKSR